MNPRYRSTLILAFIATINFLPSLHATETNGSRAAAPAEVAARNGDAPILEDVNESIGMTKPDDTITKIREKWQPPEILFDTHARAHRQLLVAGGALFIILFGAMGLWIVTLKKQVKLRRTTESALRESEERYQLAVSGSSDGLWDWNVRTNEVFHSDRLRELLGYGPDEFPNAFHVFESHLHPDDKEWVLRAIDAHMKERIPYDVEYRLRNKTGNYGWYRARGQAIWNDQGQAIRMAGSITDITMQKQSKQLLRESEERLRAVIEKTPNVAIQLYDKEGRVLFWNQASELLYGWSAADAVGKTLDHLIHTKEESEQFVAQLKKIGETGQPFGPEEIHIRRRDGSDGYCLATLFSIPSSGHDLNFVCMDVDLADLKKADAALRASETRLRTLVAASFEGIAVTEDGILTDVNDQLIEILGYESRADMLGKPVIDLIAPESRDLVRQMIESGRMEPYEHFALRKDGSVLPVEVCGRTITQSPHHVRITTVRDMTARKQAEQALHESEARRVEALQREQQALEYYTRQLIDSQESERRRIAGELHDSLGQNLLLLKNRAQMAMLSENNPVKLNEQLEGISSVAALAIAEVRQIAHALHPYQLDHLGLTRALEAMIVNAAQSTGIAFEHDLDDVEKLFSTESATNLYRVVQESLSNIIKHANASRVIIALERDVREVRLLINDNGCGFELDHFLPGGISNGLGLKNISERVRMLNGLLTVTTSPGSGSTIEVTVPIPGEL